MNEYYLLLRSAQSRCVVHAILNILTLHVEILKLLLKLIHDLRGVSCIISPMNLKPL